MRLTSGADEMRFIDANIVVDGLIDQNTETHISSALLLERIQAGAEQVAMTGPALAEVVFILRTARAGRKSAAEIASILTSFLAASSLELENRIVWIRTLELMAIHNVDLPDAHMAALLEGEPVAEVYSLDTDFDRIPGITRLET